MSADCVTPGSDPSGLAAAGGALFFTAEDGVHDRRLWTSDGTPAGTVSLRASRDHFFRSAALKGRLFFTAADRTHGREVWRSNGTRKGTVLLKDINPGVKAEGPFGLTRSGGRLFFNNDRHHERELWESDGTRKGTVLVKVVDKDVGEYTYSSQLTDVGGRLFFVAGTGIHSNGNRLWTSDGTRTGTHKVRVLDTSTANISNLTDVDGRLFFSADDGTHGTEVWTSDGTRAGTVMIRDINPSTDSEYFDSGISLTAFDGRVFFNADDGTHGPALWTSDGTRAGTVLVKDFNPSTYYGSAVLASSAGGRLFISVDDGVHGTELWRSNGTRAGTVLVRDIDPGTDADGNQRSSVPQSLNEIGGRLFFTATDDMHGRELWTSDGTRAGTRLLADIAPRASSQIGDLTAVDGRLFFTADDGTHGRELWTSDGTATGTHVVEDVNRGAGFRIARKTTADTRHGTRTVDVSVQAAGRVTVGPTRRAPLIRRSGADVTAAGATPLTLEPNRRGMRLLERARHRAHLHGRKVGRLRVSARFSFTSCADATSEQVHRYTLKLR